MAFNIRCPNCGYEGEGKTAYKGSILVGCVLLFFFIIPGLIYALWQSSTGHPSCPQCKWPNVVVTEGTTGIPTVVGLAIVGVIVIFGFAFFVFLAAVV